MRSWNELKTKQPYVVQLLRNSLSKNRLPHAYLFAGNVGVGKREIAKKLAKTLYCSVCDNMEACNECRDCLRIESQNHPDVHFVSPDGKSIKIQQIRDLKEEFSYLGVESKRKIYIIEQADRMTTQAANSLLKIMEEPSDGTLIILLTEQVQQFLPTIVSRCQIVSFRPLKASERYERLRADDIPGSLARLTTSLTDDEETAKSWAKDEWFAQARNIVIQLTEELLERPYQVLLTIHDEWLAHFKEREQIDIGLHLLLLWFRDVLMMKLKQDEEIVFASERAQLQRFQMRYSLQKIAQQIEIMIEAKKRLNANVAPQLVIEQAFINL